MGEHPHMFRKVTIIGAGLIGGSIGMAIKKQRLAREVIGVSRQHSSLVHALKNRAIDRGSHDIKKSVQDADFVILATPVKAIIEILPQISGSLRRGAIVTDVGSTKETIVEAAQKCLPAHAFYIGSHPLAGSEKKGAAFSSAELFQDSICILTPTDKTNKQTLEKVKSFWTKLGANVKPLSPSDHDKVLAYISHIPHLMAYSLMNVVPAEYLEFASQGLRDTTRIASSDPEMWSDICLVNSTPIVKSLDEVVKILSTFRKSIVSKDEQHLVENFRKAKNKRDTIDRA